MDGERRREERLGARATALNEALLRGTAAGQHLQGPTAPPVVRPELDGQRRRKHGAPVLKPRSLHILHNLACPAPKKERDTQHSHAAIGKSLPKLLPACCTCAADTPSIASALPAHTGSPTGSPTALQAAQQLYRQPHSRVAACVLSVHHQQAGGARQVRAGAEQPRKVKHVVADQAPAHVSSH